MAVILKPKLGDDLKLNFWNWRPLVALLVRTGALPPGEREERCLANGCGGCLSASEASQAGVHINELVKLMEPNYRMLLDGSISKKPKSGGKTISEMNDADWWDTYSVSYDVLKEFAEFCRRSGGFEVI